jgi:hypothetical protein
METTHDVAAPCEAEGTVAGDARRRSQPACPRCRGPARRVPRQTLDKLLDLFVPVRRYRCIRQDCRWEGRVRSSAMDVTEPHWEGRHYVIEAARMSPPGPREGPPR